MGHRPALSRHAEAVADCQESRKLTPNLRLLRSFHPC